MAMTLGNLGGLGTGGAVKLNSQPDPTAGEAIAQSAGIAAASAAAEATAEAAADGATAGAGPRLDQLVLPAVGGVPLNAALLPAMGTSLQQGKVVLQSPASLVEKDISAFVGQQDEDYEKGGPEIVSTFIQKKLDFLADGAGTNAVRQAYAESAASQAFSSILYKTPITAQGPVGAAVMANNIKNLNDNDTLAVDMNTAPLQSDILVSLGTLYDAAQDFEQRLNPLNMPDQYGSMKFGHQSQLVDSYGNSGYLSGWFSNPVGSFTGYIRTPLDNIKNFYSRVYGLSQEQIEVKLTEDVKASSTSLLLMNLACLQFYLRHGITPLMLGEYLPQPDEFKFEHAYAYVPLKLKSSNVPSLERLSLKKLGQARRPFQTRVDPTSYLSSIPYSFLMDYTTSLAGQAADGPVGVTPPTDSQQVKALSDLLKNYEHGDAIPLMLGNYTNAFTYAGFSSDFSLHNIGVMCTLASNAIRMSAGTRKVIPLCKEYFQETEGNAFAGIIAPGELPKSSERLLGVGDPSAKDVKVALKKSSSFADRLILDPADDLGWSQEEWASTFGGTVGLDGVMALDGKCLDPNQQAKLNITNASDAIAATIFTDPTCKKIQKYSELMSQTRTLYTSLVIENLMFPSTGRRYGGLETDKPFEASPGALFSKLCEAAYPPMRAISLNHHLDPTFAMMAVIGHQGLNDDPFDFAEQQRSLLYTAFMKQVQMHWLNNLATATGDTPEGIGTGQGPFVHDPDNPMLLSPSLYPRKTVLGALCIHRPFASTDDEEAALTTEVSMRDVYRSLLISSADEFVAGQSDYLLHVAKNLADAITSDFDLIDNMKSYNDDDYPGSHIYYLKSEQASDLSSSPTTFSHGLDMPTLCALYFQAACELAASCINPRQEYFVAPNQEANPDMPSDVSQVQDIWNNLTNGSNRGDMSQLVNHIDEYAWLDKAEVRLGVTKPNDGGTRRKSLSWSLYLQSLEMSNSAKPNPQAMVNANNNKISYDEQGETQFYFSPTDALSLTNPEEMTFDNLLHLQQMLAAETEIPIAVAGAHALRYHKFHDNPNFMSMAGAFIGQHTKTGMNPTNLPTSFFEKIIDFRKTPVGSKFVQNINAANLRVACDRLHRIRLAAASPAKRLPSLSKAEMNCVISVLTSMAGESTNENMTFINVGIPSGFIEDKIGCHPSSGGDEKRYFHSVSIEMADALSEVPFTPTPDLDFFPFEIIDHGSFQNPDLKAVGFNIDQIITLLKYKLPGVAARPWSQGTIGPHYVYLNTFKANWPQEEQERVMEAIKNEVRSYCIRRFFSIMSSSDLFVDETLEDDIVDLRNSDLAAQAAVLAQRLSIPVEFLKSAFRESVTLSAKAGETFGRIDRRKLAKMTIGEEADSGAEFNAQAAGFNKMYLDFALAELIVDHLGSTPYISQTYSNRIFSIPQFEKVMCVPVYGLNQPTVDVGPVQVNKWAVPKPGAPAKPLDFNGTGALDPLISAAETSDSASFKMRTFRAKVSTTEVDIGPPTQAGLGLLG